MMQLSRISLVQWHLFGRADLDLTGNGAILGKNAVGKSTLIDLIQTVMTGAAGSLYRFNRSAGEAGGRSERTLRGYCLGQKGDMEFRRPDGSLTHIALTFEDGNAAGLPVTIGLCIEALPREEPIRHCYVAEGVKIDTALFIESMPDGQTRSASWAVVRERLEQACKAAGRSLRRNDTARNHMREYMRLLFTRGRAPEPERFAKAFVLALSFEDMRSVEAFARTYLLERKDIDIGELRESIKRYRQIQKDIAELELRLAALRVIQSKIEQFDDLLKREELARGIERLAGLIEAGEALFANLSRHRAKTRDLAFATGELVRYDAEIDDARDAIERLQAQIAAQDVDSRRALVAQELKLAERDRDDVLRRLGGRFLTIARADSLLGFRDRLKPLKVGELMTALEAIRAHSADLRPPDWPRDPVGTEQAIAAAGEAARARLAVVTERRDEAIGFRLDANREIDGLRQRLAKARQGQAALEPRTEALMTALRQEGMRPRALCEVLEVVDESWRGAAEKLLGRDRETIVVEPEHASRAVTILRGGREVFAGCRVANTRRLVGLPTSPAAGSLAAVMRGEDPLAMAFLVYRVGNVRLAESQQELLEGGRAIMRDGAYNSGIVVEMLRAQGLKIGRAAAQLMQGALDGALLEQQAIQRAHDENARFFDDVLQRLEQLAKPAPAGDELDTLALELAEKTDRLADLQALLARIVAAIDPGLTQGLDSAKLRLKRAESERSDLQGRCGELRAAIAEAWRQLDGGEGLIGSRRCLTNRRRQFRERVSVLAQLVPVRAAYEGCRGARTPSRLAQDMAMEANALTVQHRSCENEIRDLLTNYRLQFNQIAPSGGEASIRMEIKPFVDDGVAALEGNELIGYRRQADEAVAQVRRIFRTAFIHELNSRFSGVETDIEMLNKALRARPLHGEIYALRATVKPEFAGLHRLARDSEADEETLAALFGRDAPKDGRHSQAHAEVERLLHDEKLDFGVYQDYRNYYGFDLSMRNEITKRETSYDRRRGVASGGERQGPFYVVIGAALASIYHGTRHFGPTSDLGMGLAVFDEAFSKMDGPNQRTMLDFYRDIGLQVLIAAPTEKRSVVYENLDSIIDVYRSGDDVSAETSHIKPRVHAAMRDANPQHLSDDDLRARLTTAMNEAAAE